MTTTLDRNGAAHHAKGAPSSQGGKFAARTNAAQGEALVPGMFIQDENDAKALTADFLREKGYSAGDDAEPFAALEGYWAANPHERRTEAAEHIIRALYSATSSELDADAAVQTVFRSLALKKDARDSIGDGSSAPVEKLLREPGTAGAHITEMVTTTYDLLEDGHAVTDEEFDEAERSYLEAAIWMATDENGAALEGSIHDFDLRDANAMGVELNDFLVSNRKLIDQATEVAEDRGLGHYGFTQVGHDFWFTRNGHGVGFWDRGLGGVGDKLTEVVRPYGPKHVFTDNDELLHAEDG